MVTKNTSIYNFESVTRYKKELGIAVAVVCLAAGAWYVYHRYTLAQEYKAQTILAECLAEYTKALHNHPENWPQVEQTLQQGYERSRSSSLAPFFLAFKAEALEHQNKFAEALNVMDAMINQLPASAPLKPLYVLKYTLMKIDGADQAVSTAGIGELESIANDASNPVHDNALYYLGMYYLNQKDLENAKKTFQRLVDEFKDTTKTVSVWSQLAQIKLQSLE